MAAVAELDTSLQALRALKPPGVTKSRIKTITDLCVENVKQESVLVQRFYTNFKRTPATHKLGVIYVVDAVTRQWIEHAMKSGQDVSGATALDGTFAAGVHRVTEMLPVLMNDLCTSAPEDQKEKIIKLIDIWERGNIFPSAMLSGFVRKLNVQSASAIQDMSQQSKTEPAAVATPSNFAHQQQPNTGNGTYSSSQNGASALASLTSSLSMNQSSSAPPPHGSAAQQNLLAQLQGIVPPELLGNTEKLTQYLQLLQQLQSMGVPQDQWSTVISVLDEQIAGGRSQPLNQFQFQPQYQPQPEPQSQPQPVPASYRNRDRSRSPVRRRESPVYGTYRTRSPLRSGSPVLQEDKILLGEPKWTDFDTTLPEGTIKVLSRTLFVGGVTCTEDELRSIFSRFGNVQTVIANTEKRHAFVKMLTRKDALAAKDGMEGNNENGRIRSTRWGVGFGPRDCSDYQTGISIVPIERLTDADRRWVLTAEHGGTGGIPLAPGLVMEEPDIEIGAGVSSKAISARRFSPRKSERESGRDKMQDRGGRRDKERQHDDRAPAPMQREHSDRGRGGHGGGANNNQRRRDSPAMNPNAQAYAPPPQHQQQQQQLQQPRIQPHQTQQQQQQARQTYENSLGVPPAVPGFGGLQLPGMGMGQGGAYR